jgi:organic radical activating enzyme
MNTKELLKDIDVRRLRRKSLNIYPTDYCNRRCPFCKLTGVLTTQEDRDDMTMEVLDTIIDFCKRSRVDEIRILGGEPSHHPQIVDLIERVYERGLHVGIIFTNGIFDNDELIKCILRHHIAINMNYLPKDKYKDGQLELVQENMRKLFLESADLKGMVGQELVKGRNFTLSITFYEPDQEYQYIIDACLKYKVGSIRWAASHSSITQENKHIHWGQLRQMVPLMLNFVRDALKAGISTCVECGLVPCILSKQEYGFFSRFVEGFRFTCEPILDVFPDLSVHYCMGMPIVSRITKENTLSQILLEQMIISEYFRRRPRSKACLKCEWRQAKLCQGYCLQYKYDKDNPQDRKLLAGLEWIENRRQNK